MPLILKRMRYAHIKGHTVVCSLAGEKAGLITSGKDGNICFWKDLGETPETMQIIKTNINAITAKNEVIYVGLEQLVHTVNFPLLEKGVLFSRFSSGDVSALECSPTGSLIISGSSSGEIHVRRQDVWYAGFKLNGHTGPILGLSVDPYEEFLASSSGDGSIKIWSIKDRELVKTWNNVVLKTSSISAATVYGTPSFHTQNGKYLAYPDGKDVVVVQRSTWNELFRLTSERIENDLSICKISTCGNYLATSSTCGEVVVWSVESKEEVGYVEHESLAKITSLTWGPDQSVELYFCDEFGRLGGIIVKDPGKVHDNMHQIRMQHFEMQLEVIKSNTEKLKLAIEFSNIAQKKSKHVMEELQVLRRIRKDCLDKAMVMQQLFSRVDAKEHIKLLKNAISEFHKYEKEACVMLEINKLNDN